MGDWGGGAAVLSQLVMNRLLVVGKGMHCRLAHEHDFCAIQVPSLDCSSGDIEEDGDMSSVAPDVVAVDVGDISNGDVHPGGNVELEDVFINVQVQ